MILLFKSDSLDEYTVVKVYIGLHKNNLFFKERLVADIVSI